MLNSNRPNSISKDVLRDEGCLWLINFTTQENLGNVGQDSLFNMPMLLLYHHHILYISKYYIVETWEKGFVAAVLGLEF